MASGARPLIGPSPVWPLAEMPAITFQKYRMKTEPRVIARTPKTVITVAAWVRFTIVEQKSPNVPESEGRRDQHDVPAHDVVGRDAAEDEHDGGDRDRGGDEDEDVGQRAQELADDDGQRRDRRRDEHVEGLLLALEADRAGRERRAQGRRRAA